MFIDAESAPFWGATRRHVMLTLQRRRRRRQQQQWSWQAGDGMAISTVMRYLEVVPRDPPTRLLAFGRGRGPAVGTEIRFKAEGTRKQRGSTGHSWRPDMPMCHVGCVR